MTTPGNPIRFGPQFGTSFGGADMPTTQGAPGQVLTRVDGVGVTGNPATGWQDLPPVVVPNIIVNKPALGATPYTAASNTFNRAPIGGVFTFNAPPSPVMGDIVIFYVPQGTANSVTIHWSGANYQGSSADTVIVTDKTTVHAIYDGAEWC
jgi:hypothetical protein